MQGEPQAHFLALFLPIFMIFFQYFQKYNICGLSGKLITVNYLYLNSYKPDELLTVEKCTKSAIYVNFAKEKIV